LPRAVALALALALVLTSCATYEGSRNMTVGSGASFGAGMAMWISGQQTDSEGLALAGLAMSTGSVIVLMASTAGMLMLPRNVELALQLSHQLVVQAEAGDCAPVVERRKEVQALDELVYQVVLMEDPAVEACLGLLSSPSSSPLPADRDLPDRASISTPR
jgi:hypothetical protein